MNDYQIFAKFYQEVANLRGHFEKQRDLLLNIFEEFHVPLDANILDAACGTLDVTFLLKRIGYSNIYGIDSSVAMIDQAKMEYKALINPTLSEWEEIENYFQSLKINFNFIYILGHSLPHLRIEKLKEFFSKVYQNLLPGGLFVFDLREWSKDINGKLFQPNRPTGEIRFLQRVKMDEVDYNLKETVSYKENCQVVDYILENCNDHSKEPAHFEYFMYTYQDSILHLIEAGFLKSNVETRRVENYPYLILIARK
jgi:SAM-dependent methyltransferase